MYILKLRLAWILLFISGPLLIVGHEEMFRAPTPYPFGEGNPNVFSVFLLYTLLSLFLFTSALFGRKN
jgi:hypothetical protein